LYVVLDGKASNVSASKISCNSGFCLLGLLFLATPATE
jgi:hypothetical protein